MADRYTRHIARLLHVIVLVVAGCNMSIPVPTAPPPMPGVAQACMDALLTGTLVADPRWGIAVLDSEAGVRKVIWPRGWSAQQNGNRLALVDQRLRVVAEEGDRVEIGGGALRDGSWVTCGEVTVLTDTR